MIFEQPPVATNHPGQSAVETPKTPERILQAFCKAIDEKRKLFLSTSVTAGNRPSLQNKLGQFQTEYAEPLRIIGMALNNHPVDLEATLNPALENRQVFIDFCKYRHDRSRYTAEQEARILNEFQRALGLVSDVKIWQEQNQLLAN